MGVVGANLLFVPALRQKSRRLIVEAAENQGFLVEAFRGAQVLKTTEAAPQVWDEYQANFGRLSHLRWKTLQLELFGASTTDMLSSFTTLALLWYGSTFVISGQLSIGQLLAFNGLGANVLIFLSSIGGVAAQFITAQVVFQRLSEVLEGTEEDPHGAEKPWVDLPLGCEIQCRKLSFHHAGRMDLLKDFDLTIPGGRMTAIIGASGCGKSTLVKLLAGLYSPQGGTIHYGKFSAKDLSLECLRHQIALIPQEPQFFNRSIIDNFRLTCPNASFSDIVAACDISLADEFIRELPDSYQTVLGEFGANLSGGQRQRLAIARALVARPPVLILDESTAALDPLLERQLLDRLIPLRQGLTTVMISHRPSVILRCDWVVYLEKGVVKFQGSP
jgi:ABC-type bacteriocin/lantibiotic exporter with double-glycine peptidase domain